MPRRGQGFSSEEVEYLLDQVEEILPIGQLAWERVLSIHELRFANMNQNVQSHQRKFFALYNHKIPTGDPNCPPAVRRAKRIYRSIVEKMDISDGVEDGNKDEEEEDEDYEDVAMSGESEDDDVEEQRLGGETLAEPVPEGPMPGVVARDDIRNDIHEPVEMRNAVAEGNVNIHNTTTQNQDSIQSTTRRTRSRGNDRMDTTRDKVRRTNAFSTPIIHSRRTSSSNSNNTTPGTGTPSAGSAMFQEYMQLMMLQREIDNESDRKRRDAEERRKETEDMWAIDNIL